MPKKFHLGLLSAGIASNWDPATGYDWRRQDLYMDVARAIERGKFDLMMLGEDWSIPDSFDGAAALALKSGLAIGALDNVVLAGAISAATSNLGIVVTQSVTYIPPFLLARQVNTLDNISNGRAGVNIVTSSASAAARNFGLDDLPEHDSRYDFADEYMELLDRLWSSWDPDAVMMDPVTRQFADPTKVRAINFKGKHFSCQGPLSSPPSPQGRPIVVMAGTSPRGKRFGAAHADMVIVHSHAAEHMRAYTEEMRGLVSDAGRDPYSLKIFFAISPIIGETDDIAKARRQAMYDSQNVENGVMLLSNKLNYDLSTQSLDQPIPQRDYSGVRGAYERYYSAGKNPTLREAARQEATSELYPIVGTPEHIADHLEELAVSVDADGFHLRGRIEYGFIIDVVDRLVPILQRRGLVRDRYTGTSLRDHLFEF